ncbi:ClpXP protease specificity-enhancing factor [Wenzhouxiangella sediminis]|uniref:ClpXP protease specificity-enhancing factor n=1 Tax=Wenzhouxiangella sediminis TaxID=1792836 RepID=A0A3E1K6K9_9GAMM|nr:ClpXP protease specificity-enhancing factor [Wenzhouxiangella sediminis]RFF29304.1 ClpXP protease specificity-enhancing factor [Wenzhouxiangella sediminis]
MISSRPYLVRAINEWIVDSGLTPHLLVDADQPGLDVPESSIQDGRVVLNISPSAVKDLLIDSEMVTFVARFGGVSRAVTVPISAVEAVYARENGRGMMFPVDEEDEDGTAEHDSGDDSPEGEKPDRKSKPNLKVVK